MKPPRTELLRAALRPASAVWEAVSRSRNLLYDHGIAPARPLPVPVVSIGNITAGGTGKTPLTIALARRLIALGVRAVVLSRGYGSKGRGTRVVSDGTGVLLAWEEAGDEPVMIAVNVPGLPVVVDPNRLRGGLAAISRFRSEIVLLDDGFQHRRLARQIDIVVLDGTDPFGRYALLPSGSLREPFGGLARAHFFLVTNAPEDEPLETMTAVLRRYNTRAPILRAAHRPEDLIEVRSALSGEFSASPPGHQPAIGLERLGAAAVFAFCGLGNPEGFRATLEATGARLVGFRAFRDHHRYASWEIDEILSDARRADAALIVTTEKDAVRLQGFPMASSFLALRIRMDVPHAETLMRAILALLGR